MTVQSNDPIIVIPADAVASVEATRLRALAELERQQAEASVTATRKRRTETLAVNTAEEVTDEVLAAALELFATRYADEDRTDWWDFFDRLEDSYKVSVSDTESAAAKKIQRTINNHRRETE
jgi:hypothetical protein